MNNNRILSCYYPQKRFHQHLFRLLLPNKHDHYNENYSGHYYNRNNPNNAYWDSLEYIQLSMADSPPLYKEEYPHVLITPVYHI